MAYALPPPPPPRTPCLVVFKALLLGVSLHLHVEPQNTTSTTPKTDHQNPTKSPITQKVGGGCRCGCGCGCGGSRLFLFLGAPFAPALALGLERWARWLFLFLGAPFGLGWWVRWLFLFLGAPLGLGRPWPWPLAGNKRKNHRLRLPLIRKNPVQTANAPCGSPFMHVAIKRLQWPVAPQ
jgi:hypothetical protein